MGGRWKPELRNDGRRRREQLEHLRDVAARQCAEEAVRGFRNTWRRDPDLADDEDLAAMVSLFQSAPSFASFGTAQDNLGLKKQVRFDRATGPTLVKRHADAVMRDLPLDVPKAPRDTIARSIRMSRDDFARLEAVPGETLRERVMHLVDLFERKQRGGGGSW